MHTSSKQIMIKHTFQVCFHDLFAVFYLELNIKLD